MAYPTKARRRVDQREQHPNRYAVRDLAGALVLTLLDSEVQVLDPDGADRAVTLPTGVTAADAGCAFVLRHGGSANTLTVDTDLVVLAAGDWVEVFVSPAGAWTIARNGVAPVA